MNVLLITFLCYELLDMSVVGGVCDTSKRQHDLLTPVNLVCIVCATRVGCHCNGTIEAACCVQSSVTSGDCLQQR